MMTVKEKENIKKMLNRAVKNYQSFAVRDDLDTPCVKREMLLRQRIAFNLANYLFDYDLITWEECCKIWCKIGFTDDDESCDHKNCDANIEGKCKYQIKKGGEQ